MIFWSDSREYVVSVEDVGEALSVVIDTVEAAVVDIHYHNLHTYILKHVHIETHMYAYTVNTYPSFSTVHTCIYCIH